MGKTIYSLNIPETGKERIVLIGGGFGGVNFLDKLKSDMYQVVVLDRYNYHTFQPLLYQVATAGLEPDSVAGPLRKKIHGKKDWYFRMLKVNRIEMENSEVITAAGTLKYDHLVIASGSRVNYFGNDSIAKNAYPVKQVTHALDLRSTIFQQFEKLEVLAKQKNEEENLNFVVVGAGPTGVEICGALAELKKHVLPKDYPELNISRMKIILVEGLAKVLPAMSETSGQKAKKYLENEGVEVILECMTEDYDGKTVKLSNGTEIATNTLIWAAGVKPNVPEGIADKYLEKGALRVDQYNRLCLEEGNLPVENVYAIGDCATMKTENYPDGLPGLAPVAIQQGRHLAQNLVRMKKSKPLKPFEYTNKGVMATVGRNRAVADLPGNRKLSGLIGWIAWMMVHLLYLVGFRNKTVVFTNWMWNYFTYDRGVRLIIRPSSKSQDRISKDLTREMRMEEQS